MVKLWYCLWVVKDRNNPLKPDGYCMYHHISDSKLHIVPTQCVYCFKWFLVEREIIFQCSIQWLTGFQTCDSVCSVPVWTGFLVFFRLNCAFTRYTIILLHVPILVIILLFSCNVNSVFMITLATYFLMILKTWRLFSTINRLVALYCILVRPEFF